MNQQPDKYFREKLKDYQRPAPASAWDRIESGLQKKTTVKFEWWKVAASLLLLTSVGYGLWVYRTSTDKQPLAKTELETETQKPGEHKSKDGGTPLNHREKDISSENEAVAQPLSKSETKENVTSKNVIKYKTQTVAAQKSPLTSEPIQPAEVTSMPEPVVASVDSVVPPTKKSSNITLTITAEETNQYLDKNALAQATSEEKKSSTFKKLLRKAGDLKSNQDPFGDLREKKNEILALNFKNEKRGQNK